jgi:hypothetical protein
MPTNQNSSSSRAISDGMTRLETDVFNSVTIEGIQLQAVSFTRQSKIKSCGKRTIFDTRPFHPERKNEGHLSCFLVLTGIYRGMYMGTPPRADQCGDATRNPEEPHSFRAEHANRKNITYASLSLLRAFLSLSQRGMGHRLSGPESTDYRLFRAKSVSILERSPISED